MPEHVPHIEHPKKRAGFKVLAALGIVVAAGTGIEHRSIFHALESSGGNFLDTDSISRNGMTIHKDYLLHQDGDPLAGNLPRNWSSLIVAKTDLSELTAYQAKHHGWLQAVMFQRTDGVDVVISHDGSDLFTALTNEQSSPSLAVAMRIGPNPLDVAMGLFNPTTQACSVARTVGGDLTTVVGLQNQYRGVGYV